MSKSKEVICATWRGSILQMMVYVEARMDNIILWYFCGNNLIIKDDFSFSILYKEQFNLGFKFIVLSYIAKNRYKGFLLSYPSLLDDIEALISVRNDFAHRYFSPQWEINKDKNKMFLKKYTSIKSKRRIKYIEISPKIIGEHLTKIGKVHGILCKLQEQVVKDVNRSNR